MKLTLNTNHAAHLLMQDEHSNWSRAAAFALCDYLEELEEDSGVVIEFCPVAIRCDYSQYADLEEWALEQWITPEKAWQELGLVNGDSNEFEEAIRDYIRDRGALIEFDGGMIVSRF
tara:strand:+ start:797 stop:1147 length:351 start_codon:yes stop_codon:yes gene_type:complete